MSSSENQAVTCPQCRRPEVHFDRKTGFYCGACDREFSSEEAKVLVENEVFKIKSDD
jgi:ribosomal protein L37AE/L43A